MIDLKAKRFGRLTVIKDSGKRKNRGVVWLCKCDCGNLVEIRSHCLIEGFTKSCGCLWREVLKKVHTKHGDSRRNNITRLFRIWADMKARCSYPSYRAYCLHGQKGITVCPEWIDDYQAFKFWAILNGYQENLTIDRIDNDGDYEPNNCQWITLSENVKKSHVDRRKMIQDL